VGQKVGLCGTCLIWLIPGPLPFHAHTTTHDATASHLHIARASGALPCCQSCSCSRRHPVRTWPAAQPQAPVQAQAQLPTPWCAAADGERAPAQSPCTASSAAHGALSAAKPQMLRLRYVYARTREGCRAARAEGEAVCDWHWEVGMTTFLGD
jgi:hypothetical protein